MKLRNKQTGEIGWLYCDHISVPKKMTVFSEDKDLSAKHWDYTSLSELNEEWEDYEEPKEYWYIENNGDIDKETYDGDDYEERMIEIGNYFESKEEAKKAVEKLKAWKRLRDKGLKLELCSGIARGEIKYYLTEESEETERDLRTCFGGVE